MPATPLNGPTSVYCDDGLFCKYVSCEASVLPGVFDVVGTTGATLSTPEVQVVPVPGHSKSCTTVLLVLPAAPAL